MCEFLGWIDLQQDLTREKKILENMLSVVNKLESYQSLLYASKNALLGCVSSKVPNPEEQEYGKPMTKTLGNNLFTITYCGQLENLHQVKENLRKLGIDCKSSSDEEIILSSYIAWGQEFIKHIKGSYIFAIWDESRKALSLVRDPQGESTLFYALKANSFIYSSDVKALIGHPLLGHKTAHSLNGGIPNDVKELEPGYCLIFTKQGIHIKLL